MLKIVRSVCDHVTTDYTEVISNGHHYQPGKSTPQDADDQTRQGTPDRAIRRDNSQAKPPLIRTETLSTPTTIPNPTEEKIENLANALSFYNLCILTISRIMPSPDSGRICSWYEHPGAKVAEIHASTNIAKLLPTYAPLYTAQIRIIIDDNYSSHFQEVIKDDPDKEHYSDAVDGVGIPELDDTPWKAALLGDTTLLDVDVERAATDHRCTMLDVVDWDSIEVHQ
ncbi:hypothetical protein IFR04_015953 [Cadophora malorum]|uniref:Uncharacterized protein n=1 Tax=Cadophora malorum TaxID=108018 RepID=A0A8H7W4S9_9HELO|nr:hypothetical protein IFR04_015953 [Cadophora malorum]